MALNELIPFYEPGDRITGHNANVGTIPGKRCVRISANRTPGGPELQATAGGGTVTIDYAAAAGRIFGVTAHDVAPGGKVTIVRGPGFVVPIKSAGVIAAFAEVESNATGEVITKSAGVAIGFAIDGCASGDDAQIALY